MSTQDSGNSQPSFPSLCKNGCGFFGGKIGDTAVSVLKKSSKKKKLKNQAIMKNQKLQRLLLNLHWRRNLTVYMKKRQKLRQLQIKLKMNYLKPLLMEQLQ